MERKILIPKRNGSEENEELNLIDNLVIVGANGSGKSRFGSRIEQNTNDKTVKRISAQRYLQFEDVAQQKTLTQSLQELLNDRRNRNVIEPQNDYNIVLSSLFAETGKRNEEYVELCKRLEGNERPPIPESSIEKLIKIWNDVFPHRQILVKDNKVSIIQGDTTYSAREMSDGEKVSLYLISQSLILPVNCVVIIDEPELHLHKALMARLWNEIEKERADCIFVYITHDLDFASSRVKANKIWIKTYETNRWTWEEVPLSDQIPENLLLEIIGSRKPILFVEGERGSYDHQIYQYVYPEYSIIPRGGSFKVIESVRGVRANESLHSIKAYGLIDRDYKTDEEIAEISKEGVFVIEIAEVENLLLMPSLIKLVAGVMRLDEEETFEKTKGFVLAELEKEFQNVVSYRTSLIINYKLNAFDTKKIGIDRIEEAIASLVASIKVSDIFSQNSTLYQQILEQSDYEGLLRYYNNKGLLPQVSRFLDLAGGRYSKMILRLLNSEDKREEIVAALKQYLPEIIEA